MLRRKYILRKVELYVDCLGAVVQSFHQLREHGFNTGNQVIVADDGIEGVSTLESHSFLIASETETFNEELYDFVELIFILLEEHVCVVSEQQTHPGSQNY